MAQWLERGALPMSLPVMRFQTPLGAEFSEKYHVSPSQSWDIVSTLCPWARYNGYDKVQWPKYLQDCMLSVKLKCTRMNRFSDQGVKCKVGSSDLIMLISNYKHAPLPLRSVSQVKSN